MTDTGDRSPRLVAAEAERATSRADALQLDEPQTETPAPLELSVVIPALDEEGNIGPVVQGCRRVCEALGIEHEIVVVDGHSRDSTAERAAEAGAEVIVQEEPGYGAALRAAFARVRGRYVATLDSDLSHPPDVLRSLYRNRDRADLLIASRFTRGGMAVMPLHRQILSVVLNRLYSWALAIPVRDLSSGFRLYRRDMLRELDARNRDFSFLQEILVKAYSAGYSVHEVPFHYLPRVDGSSKARILAFGVSYAKLLHRSWLLRHSSRSADHEERAFSSLILPRRWSQRQRYKAITGWADRVGRVVQINCGSSRILEALPGAIGMDLAMPKLRYRRALGNPLVRATIERLPLRDECFDQLICCQVIDRVAEGERVFEELSRVLKPGGSLLIGTAGTTYWRWECASWITRRLPGARHGQPVNDNALDSLRQKLDQNGFDVLEHRRAYAGGLLLRARKRAP